MLSENTIDKENDKDNLEKNKNNINDNVVIKPKYNKPSENISENTHRTNIFTPQSTKSVHKR